MFYLKRRFKRVLLDSITNSSIARNTFLELKTVYERKLQIFSVGLPLSGTHSIANNLKKSALNTNHLMSQQFKGNLKFMKTN